MSNRAADAQAVQFLMDRLRMVQSGGCPAFALVFDASGVHVREIVQAETLDRTQTASGRTERHYVTYYVTTGHDVTEAVKNARIGRWASEQ